MRKIIFILFFSLFQVLLLFGQTHVSVPLNHQIYILLDQAEARGLCAPLPAVKPYTKARIVSAINEILAAEPGRFGELSGAERKILEDAQSEFTDGESGFDLRKGKYRYSTQGKSKVPFAMDAGIALESLNSVSYSVEEEKPYLGTDTWGSLYLSGDVGEKFSFHVDFSTGFMKAQRAKLGTGNTYATELESDPSGEHVNQLVDVYSQPLAFFPYTYQKNWDGFMFNLGEISASNMEKWPDSISIAARLLSEMSGSVFDDMLLLRAGRFQREWGAMAPGSSLVFNAAARPFLGIEAIFNPAPWFAFSSMTGVLEFDNSGGIMEPAMTFQNAFSLQQVDINVGNYFHIDLGSSSIWSKRFELGYLFPLLDNFFYQNFIGDFDNMGIHLNLKGRYPGLGSIWFSFFADEIEISSMAKAFELDRHMFAYQIGLQGLIPLLPFASVTASYTKIEPYTYTHTRTTMPWYGDSPMESAYINNGVSMGYYLPPNSDELKLRFDMHPFTKTVGFLQYQLIRHGADYGPHQVDGSSLVSELDPSGRSEKDSLRKNFLKDGAYQWMHIIKIGANHRFDVLPLTIFGEAGLAYSYFTDIGQTEYDTYNPVPPGGTPRDPAEGNYSTSTVFILTVGFRIFR